ncbi:hypothetical protein SCB49_11187, partial [unidentified eubacterium SCB49]
LYVYDNVDGSWVFSTKLVASDLSGDAKLGMNPTTLDVEGDTIIVGAPGETGWTGSVYVFTRTNGVWEESQKIVSPFPEPVSSFGIGVSFLGDDLMIGSDFVDERKGAIYSFVKNTEGVWEYDQTITASNPAVDDFFGNSISLDEDQLLVGAYGKNSEVGAAYVFERNDQGTWIETQQLNPNSSSEVSQFGWSTLIEDDFMVIASPHVYGYEPGEVYTYNKDASGTWVENEIIQGNDTEGEDFYGWSFSLYNDDLIIGANREDHDENGENEIFDTGSAYIFERPAVLGGLSDDAISDVFTVYPNPTSNFVTISSKTNSVSKIKLINELGMILKEETVKATNEYQLDISDLAQGVYFLNLESQTGEISSKKIIKVE